jgi:hypothetical protein
MKRIHVYFVAATVMAFAAGIMLGQKTDNYDRWWTPEKDATVAAPGNHKILFENDEVRVLEVHIDPLAKEPMHVHRTPAAIYLESSPHLIEHLEDGTKNDMGNRPDGLARYIPISPAHSLENLDPKKPLKAIRVELKKAR